MNVERICLDWAVPVLDHVVSWLLQNGKSGPVLDLSCTMVVVPTKQAGRRLREALAMQVSAHGGALVPPVVRTPTAFLDQRGSSLPLAGPVLSLAVWVHILRQVDCESLRGLFPTAPVCRDVGWALRMGEMIQRVRSQLVEGGYLIRDVVTTCGDDLEELERWQNLALLESHYLGCLVKGGMQDRFEWQVTQTADPVVGDEIRRIVIACVPDPSLIMVRAMEKLANRLPISVLIHCAPDEFDAFDEWGRPLGSHWKERTIPIPRPESNIVLGANPFDQARSVRVAIEGLEAGLGPADIAIGVPDQDVIPFVENQLESLGLVSFNPAGKPINQHSTYYALDAVAQLLSPNPGYSQVSACLRNPDILSALQQTKEVEPEQLLKELDRFQNRYLPEALSDMERAGDAGAEHKELRKAIAFLDEIRSCQHAETVSAALQQWAELLYRHTQVDPQTPDGETFQAVAGRFQQAIRETQEPLFRGLKWSIADSLGLILSVLSRECLYEDRPDAQVDLEGWLELHWNSAPFLIVTGMNDGFVPDTRLSDVFLPDSLRKRLGLRSDETRLVRDIYLLSAMSASRQQDGRILLIAGAQSRSGDPLHPSRLLFRCPDGELTERVAMLFHEPEWSAPNHAATVSFRLDATAGHTLNPLQRVGVTSLSNYLRCPYRFYLQHVLRAEAVADDQTELDAGRLGDMVHQALRGLEKHPECLDDVDRMIALFRSEVDAWVAAIFGDHCPLPVRVQVESLKRRLQEAARKQAELTEAGWIPWRYEYRCERQIGPIRLTGKIDRIDHHVESNRIRIIDFKTRDNPLSMREVHFGPVRPWHRDYALIPDARGKIRSWKDLQLPIYVDLLQEELGEQQIEAGIFHLPKALSDTGLEIWEDLNSEVISSARQCAEGIVMDIAAGRFWPPAPNLPYEDEYACLFAGSPLACLDPGALVEIQDRDREGQSG